MSGEKTKWEGLWRQREAVYSGKVIKKKDLPDKARLIVRYNKYYASDSNRPKFIYCFASGEAYDAITLESDDEYTDCYRLTYTQLQALIDLVATEAGGPGEYGRHIVNDFLYQVL
jgi:hypothetical protein